MSRPDLDRCRPWAADLVEQHLRGTDAAPATTETYQVSTIRALMAGIDDGDTTILELLRHGDFGLGTFNGLDGEMVILDGECHHLRADGTAMRANPTDLTPFAAVMPFRAEFEIPIRSATDRAGLTELVDASLASVDHLHGIRVEGEFSALHTRTVKAQSRPYPSLTEATRGQAETVFDDVTGTLVGFRTPDADQGISVAGYHLHFLDSAHQRGGHALDFVLDSGRVAVSHASDLQLHLPPPGSYLDANLSAAELSAQIRQAEGDG